MGDFHAAGPYPLGWLALHLSWVFIAPLVQLTLAYPSGRPRSLVTIAVVGTTWVATATPWVNWNDDITLATAIAALALSGQYWRCGVNVAVFATRSWASERCCCCSRGRSLSRSSVQASGRSGSTPGWQSSAHGCSPVSVGPAASPSVRSSSTSRRAHCATRWRSSCATRGSRSGQHPAERPPAAPDRPASAADEQPDAPAAAADAAAAGSRSPSPARSESGVRRARAVAAAPNKETTEPRLENDPPPRMTLPGQTATLRRDTGSAIRVLGTTELLVDRAERRNSSVGVTATRTALSGGTGHAGLRGCFHQVLVRVRPVLAKSRSSR